jgi:hypothetical protein
MVSVLPKVEGFAPGFTTQGTYCILNRASAALTAVNAADSGIAQVALHDARIQ